jgi:enoyl-CoA hydratase/carnithine racemase
LQAREGKLEEKISMEIEAVSNAPKLKKRTVGPEDLKKAGAIKKLDPEAAKLLAQLKERANKKTFGRRVRESDILAMSLKLVTQDHIKELQEATYSEKDRLEMIHAQYQKEHGKLTLDQFIGLLMRGEVKLT